MREGTELGRFLRARRAQIRPEDVGLPAGIGIRRTPGLRREELATLAGVSIDYYTRLERGREARPSPAVVAALGEALRLSGDALRRLHELAALAAGQAQSPSASMRAVRESIRVLLEMLRPSPAYVVSRTNDLLATNLPGFRLFPGITDWSAEHRNTTRYMFLHPMARALHPDWAKMAAHNVAHLRAIAGADPDMPDLAQLVGELVLKSPEFARLWERYDVQRARGGNQKHFQHPEVGSMRLTFEVMEIQHTDGQRLISYQARPGTPDHDAMMLLSMDNPAEATLAERTEL